MTDQTIPDSQAPAVRYFRDPDGGSIQEVHNLADDAPYLELGLVEITEADHLAAMEAIEADLTMPEPETTE